MAGLGYPSWRAAVRFGVVGTVCLSAFSEAGYGQVLRVSNPTATTLDTVSNVGQVGNTRLNQNFGRSFTTGRGVGAAPPRQSGQQLLRASRQMSSFRSRRTRRGNQVGFDRSHLITQQVKNNWHKRLSVSGAARYVRQPPRYYTDRTVQPDATVSNVLLQPRALLRTTAFLGPLWGLGITTGGVRDVLSTQDRPMVSPYTSSPLPTDRRNTQSELMAARLVTMRERARKEAWQWFSQEEYGRARSSFQSVEMLDRSDMEPRLGMFLCCIAEERYSQAGENFKKIMRLDMDPSMEPFRDYNIAARYMSPRLMRTHTRNFMEYFDAHSDDVRLYIALCYYLWHTDAREQALLGAQHIIKMDPTGPGGRFGRLMLQAATGDDVAAAQ